MNTPIFLIGPARSGTKLLREILNKSELVNSIPFDINPTWQYIFNLPLNSDELINYDEHKFSLLKKFINKFGDNKFILEKTISNCIRIKQIAKFIPDAKFIIIYRNPFDTIRSVRENWYKNNNLVYTFKKLKIFSLPIINSFIFRKLKFKKKYKCKVWGLIIPDVVEAIDNNELDKAAWIQWDRSMNSLDSFLEEKNNRDRAVVITYENLINQPQKEVTRICKFLEIEPINKLPIIDNNRNLGLKNNNSEELIELIKKSRKKYKHIYNLNL